MCYHIWLLWWTWRLLTRLSKINSSHICRVWVYSWTSVCVKSFSFVDIGKSSYSFTSLFVITSAFSRFPFASLSRSLIHRNLKQRWCFRLHKSSHGSRNSGKSISNRMFLHHLQIQFLCGDEKCSFAGVTNLLKIALVLFVFEKQSKWLSQDNFLQSYMIVLSCSCYSKTKHEQLWRIISIATSSSSPVCLLSLCFLCAVCTHYWQLKGH